jgi:hypothetical protein
MLYAYCDFETTFTLVEVKNIAIGRSVKNRQRRAMNECRINSSSTSVSKTGGALSRLSYDISFEVTGAWPGPRTRSINTWSPCMKNKAPIRAAAACIEKSLSNSISHAAFSGARANAVARLHEAAREEASGSPQAALAAGQGCWHTGLANLAARLFVIAALRLKCRDLARRAERPDSWE